jgi:hypothetical protein
MDNAEFFGKWLGTYSMEFGVAPFWVVKDGGDDIQGT